MRLSLAQSVPCTNPTAKKIPKAVLPKYFSTLFYVLAREFYWLWWFLVKQFLVENCWIHRCQSFWLTGISNDKL